MLISIYLQLITQKASFNDIFFIQFIKMFSTHYKQYYKQKTVLLIQPFFVAVVRN